VAVSDLPAEAGETLDAIEAGPPYPYDRDGVTFETREGLLPDEEYGYYQEFTVTTPGSSDRGARRIIWGLEDELYYTGDHYASFSRIQP
jgi:ribonuclease T1